MKKTRSRKSRDTVPLSPQQMKKPVLPEAVDGPGGLRPDIQDAAQEGVPLHQLLHHGVEVDHRLVGHDPAARRHLQPSALHQSAQLLAHPLIS
jgi:hypothetical protein